MSGASLPDTRKITAARVRAAVRFPYLASAIFAAPVVSRSGCGTVAVDRQWRIYADPVVVGNLEVDELAKLLVHLCGHVLRDHAARAGTLRVEEEEARAAWNNAADAELNDDLREDDAVPDSAPVVPSDLGCPERGLAESYFSHGDAATRRWDCGSGCDNGARPWDEGEVGDGAFPEGLNPSQSALLRLGVAAEVQRCAQREPGSVPGGWRRWAESVLPSRVDWRRVLAAEIRRAVAVAAGKVDYTYRRPSRRASTVERVILPTLYRPVPEVAVVCDTSGSMHEQLLARALAEIEGMLTRGGLRQAQVRVLAVDTNVQAVRRVSRASQVELAGGGGTDMGRGISAAADLRPRPAVIIVLTDGFTPWPADAPAGSRVVVGLLEQPPFVAGHHPTPDWARVVHIQPDVA